MNEKGKIRYHGNDVGKDGSRPYGGITSRWNKYTGQWHYRITYKWVPWSEELAGLVNGTVGKAKRIHEPVPSRKDGKHTKAKALRVKQTRDNARHGEGWVPPHIQAKLDARRRQVEEEQEAERARIAEAKRKPLLFETARDNYLDYLGAIGRKKTSVDAAESHLRTLGRFFGGRMLDDITEADVEKYFIARLSQSDPFGPDWRKKPVGPRAPESDIATFRALYRRLAKTHKELAVHPCIRPVDRGKGSLLAPYEPVRAKVIPDEKTLVEIFTARARAKTGGNGARGRELIRDEHRALWLLIYATVARPEEPCRLVHDNVSFHKDGWASVKYDDVKNRHSRRKLPVFPEAAAALKAVMDPKPTNPFDKDAEEAWKARPIFRKGKADDAPAWDCKTYAKAWAACKTVVEGIDGMTVRDLRSTANTRLRRAGVEFNVRQRFLGHSEIAQEGRYDLVNDHDLRLAASSLRLPNFSVHFLAHQGLI